MVPSMCILFVLATCSGVAQTLSIPSGDIVVTPGALVAVHGAAHVNARIDNAGALVINGSLTTDSAAQLRNTGVVRFMADTASWLNAAPYASIQQNGLLSIACEEMTFADINGDAWGATALGRNAESRIGGMVAFERDSGTQILHRRWWTSLALRNASTKVVDSGTAVSEEYKVSGGRRAYQGSFVYDGAAPQRLAAEHGSDPDTNQYKDLVLTGGVKSITPADTVAVQRRLMSNADATLTIQGVLEGGDAARLAAETHVRDGGRLTMADSSEVLANIVIDDGGMIVPASSTTMIRSGATLQLADNARATIRLDSGAAMRLEGDYVNAYPPRTNAWFDTSSSIVFAASNRQSVESSAASHPYGHVVVEGSTKDARGNVHVAGSLHVRSTLLDMRPHRLSMGLARAMYDDQAEVVGLMQRSLLGAQTGVIYHWNNAETSMQFDVLPDSVTWSVQPGIAPHAYDSTTDVLRKISLEAVGDWKATMRIGYTLQDIPATWSTRTSQHLLRFVRTTEAPADSVVKLVPTLPPSYQRRAATTQALGFVELQGLRSSGPDNVVVPNGNDIVLRGSREVLTAIASGRWSNPSTWDEGREPEPDDDVRIDGVTVHAGFLRASDAWGEPEQFPGALATTVIIADTPNSSLLLGSTDSATAFALKESRTSLLTVQRGATAGIATSELDATAAPVDGGLIVYPNVVVRTPNLVVAPAATVTNAGTLVVGVP